jgi:hypothetical protein
LRSARAVLLHAEAPDLLWLTMFGASIDCGDRQERPCVDD